MFALRKLLYFVFLFEVLSCTKFQNFRGSAHDSWGSLQRSPDPQAGEDPRGRARCPLPKNSIPPSALRASGFAPSM